MGHNLYRCGDCGGAFRAVQLAAHQAECAERLASCLHCDERVRFKDMARHEASECQRRPVACAWCFDQIPAANMAKHLEVCESKAVTCEHCKGSWQVRGIGAHLGVELFFFVGGCRRRPPKAWDGIGGQPSATSRHFF